MLRPLTLIVTTLLLTSLATGTALGQEAPEAQEAPKPTKIFRDDRVISARAEGPWRTIARKKDSGEVFEGVFRYTEADGREISIPIEITTRGLTRKRVCDFPPLRIRFDKEASKGTAFRGAGRLKLVTHCLKGGKYEQYYVKEFLAYKIYNLATEKSFRVQGLDMSYAEKGEDDKPLERFAFLIEDPDDVAKRNDLEKLSINDIQVSRLDPMETSRFVVFQYLIGNLDWSVLGGPSDHCCHNARLIGASPEATPVYGIPYDLDSTGLVNAHYAAPPQGLGARSIRQRVYRGFCAHNDSLRPAIDEFMALRGDIEALMNNESRLDSGNRKRALKYLDEGFETLASEKEIQDEFIDNCRG